MDFEIILVSRKQRFETLKKIIDQLDDETLNKQIFSNKKTIAEITSHIIQLDSSPFFIWMIFYNILNLFRGYYSKLEGKDVLFLNYKWDLEKPKKNWKPKFIPKTKLEKGIRRIEQRLEIPKKHLRARFMHERHANQHLRQIEFLVNTLT